MTLSKKLCALIALLVWASVLGCNASPDKRILQYLNTDGFGNRYTGNAEEENWIAINDKVSITDSYNKELEVLNATVDIDGTILLPELGAVLVAGLTRTEIEALLMEKYSPYYDLLDIRVKITTFNKKYFIFGEVATQGEVDFKGDLTIFEAVAKANPTKETANLGRVRLIRADPDDPLIQTVDLGDMITRGDSTFNIHVHERDIIFVPATMLAELGYFLDTLLFPVKQVLSGLGSALFSIQRLGGNGYGGNGFFNF
jgi:protein involved in polysaccharide export with SLBB domain